MIQLLEANWPLFAIALVLGVAVAWWVFVARRRTSVTFDSRDVLDDGHGPAARNQALIDAPPVAATAPLPSAPPAGGGDDLTRIKGLGPKIAELLHAQGITRLDQIAAWSEADVARIDPTLGRFAGRIAADNWPEQARLLIAGDTAGYEAKFGRL